MDASINPFTLPFFAANSGVPIRVIASAGGWGVMEVVAQGKLGLHSIGDVKAYVQAKKPKLKVGTLQGGTWNLILDARVRQGGASRTRTSISSTSTTCSAWSRPFEAVNPTF